MDGQQPPSNSPRDLSGVIGASAARLILGVRRSAAFNAADRMPRR
jgi:hypothetical protein